MCRASARLQRAWQRGEVRRELEFGSVHLEVGAVTCTDTEQITAWADLLIEISMHMLGRW